MRGVADEALSIKTGRKMRVVEHGSPCRSRHPANHFGQDIRGLTCGSFLACHGIEARAKHARFPHGTRAIPTRNTRAADGTP
jgi:hypothetical protein